MKLNKVNKVNDPVRHAISHAPAVPAGHVTYGARSTPTIQRGKVVFVWRIFNQNGKAAK